MPFFPYPSLRKPLHAFAGAVGSSSNIPSFISSCALGRCCNFCSKLSARICFCNSLCCPCIEGAALESGRIFPNEPQDISHLRPLTSGTRVMNEKLIRSINSSLSGRFSNPFLRLSLACWRSSSNCADCIALFSLVSSLGFRRVQGL